MYRKRELSPKVRPGEVIGVTEPQFAQVGSQSRHHDRRESFRGARGDGGSAGARTDVLPRSACPLWDGSVRINAVCLPELRAQYEIVRVETDTVVVASRSLAVAAAIHSADARAASS